MTGKRTYTFILLYLTLVAIPVVGQSDLSLEVIVSQSTLYVGEEVKITYSVNCHAKDLKAPDFEGFKLVSGPNTSTKLEFKDGKSSGKTAWHFVLRALRPGVYSILPASLVIDSTTYHSEAVAILVKTGANPDKKEAEQHKRPEFTEEEKGKLAFIKTEISDSVPIVGQSFEIQRKLYFRHPIKNAELLSGPEYNGLITQWDFEADEKDKIVIDGKTYQVSSLMHAAFYAKRPGSFQIDPIVLDLVMQIPIEKEDASMFDKFFQEYDTISIRAVSDTFRFRVSEFPTEIDMDYSSAIGEFEVKLMPNNDEADAEDYLRVNYEIKGSGNLDQVDPPTLVFSDKLGFVDYSLKKDTGVVDNQLIHTYTFQYRMTCSKKGTYVIDSKPFTYFDPEHQVFVSKIADAVSVQSKKKNGN